MNPLIMVDLTLFLLTWNVKQSEPDYNYGRLLNYALNNQNNTRRPDVIAIGLQEVSFSLISPITWIDKAKEILGDEGYIMVKKKSMIGMVLMVLVKKELLLEFRNIKSTSTTTGFFGVIGNKGAISTRFDIVGAAISITNSHLAAHDHNLETRITEYKKIYGGQSFELGRPDYRSVKLEDHDISLWMGDLNFRLDDLTGQEILQKIVNADLTKDPLERKNLLNSLKEHDQLSNSRKLNRAFDKFNESDFTFSPTYKFKPGTNEYDLGRKPAWCDRILHRKKGESSIGLLPEDYRSHPEYIQSDHKPVSSFFTISLPHRRKRETQTDFRLKFLTPHDWRIYQDSTAYYTIDIPETAESADEELSSGEGLRDKSRKKRSLTSTSIDTDQVLTKLSEFDWIGLYPEDFSDVEEPLSFVWANPEPVPNLPQGFIRPSTSSMDSSNYSSSYTDNFIDSNMIPFNVPLFRAEFSELVLLRPGKFRLLYITENGDILAMSEPFEIKE